MKANVLFFDRKPAQERPWTQRLWIYDLRTNLHFTLTGNPLNRSDLDEFVKCYNPRNRHERKESERFKSFAYDELSKCTCPEFFLLPSPFGLVPWLPPAAGDDRLLTLVICAANRNASRYPGAQIGVLGDSENNKHQPKVSS